MAINPNIALSFQAPKFDDPINKLAQIEQLKAYRQNALLKEREAALAEKAMQSENALRNLYASGKPVSFEQAYALGGTKGAEVAMAQAKSQEAEARRKSAERKSVLDTVNVGRTSLAAVPDDPASYGKWRQEFTSQYPEMTPFFPGEESYVPATEGGMGTKRQLLLTADQLAKDENALNRLNLQLNAQRELQQERLKSQENIAMANRESRESIAEQNYDLQRDRYQLDLNKYKDETDPSYVARVTTNSAGDVIQTNRSGDIIGVVKNAGMPSAEFQKSQNQKAKAINDLTVVVDEIERAKKEGLFEQATGSTAGAFADSLGRVVGLATKGGMAISELEPVADLVLKMVPRFEGPQSDADRKNYEAAAGRLADPGRPYDEKMSALKTIERLLGKYKENLTLNFTPTSKEVSRTVFSGSRSESEEDGLTPEEQAEYEALKKRFGK